MFGEELKKARKKKGYSQESLAEKLNVSRQTVYRWENDTAIPNPENIKKLNEILDCDLFYYPEDNASAMSGCSEPTQIEQEEASFCEDDKKHEVDRSDSIKEVAKSAKKYLALFILSTVFTVIGVLATYIIHGIAFISNTGDMVTVRIYVDKSVFYIVLILTVLLFATAALFLIFFIKLQKKCKCKQKAECC